MDELCMFWFLYLVFIDFIMKKIIDEELLEIRLGLKIKFKEIIFVDDFILFFLRFKLV